MTKTKKSAGLDLVRECCRVLEEKKAEAVTVLDVSEQSSITNYLVLATATSEPHLRALRVELEKALDQMGARIVGMEMAQESGWMVIDVFDVMVHLFLGATREHYSLERLWRDATEVPLSKITGTRELRKPATKRAKRATTPRSRKSTKRSGGTGSA